MTTGTLITVAPTGAESSKAAVPALPVTLDELVATAKECEALGASVIHIHIRDDLVDPQRYYVATEKARLIGRMHGRGWYARTSDLFLMDRISLAKWKDGKR